MKLPASNPHNWETPPDFHRDIANLAGNNTHIYTNLLPSGPYRGKHFHIFMNAMQPWSEWLYNGDTLPDEPDNFFSLGPCMRSDGGLQAIGTSPKRLLLFQMLGYEGRSSEADLEWHIALVHAKISAIFKQNTTIGCRIHPDTNDTIGSMLHSLGINFETTMDCIFQKPTKTDRSGYRIEFVTEDSSQMELFNFVILTRIKNAALSNYILDGGGSLERMLMVREGVASADQTSIFPLASEIYTLWADELWIETKRKIVNLIRGIAYLKINHISTSQSNHHDSIHKTLSTLYRMLYIAVYELLGHVDIDEVLGWFEKEISYITSSERDLQNLRERMEAMEREKNKIMTAFRQFWESSFQKITNRYCGWCSIFPALILKKEIL